MKATTKEQTEHVRQNLAARIASECTPINREERFDEMLDENYSLELVGGPFAHMSAARVLKEMDPTAYRCGINDYSDGESWVEVDGEEYESRDVEAQRAEYVAEMEAEAEEMEEALETQESEVLRENLEAKREAITIAENLSL